MKKADRFRPTNTKTIAQLSMIVNVVSRLAGCYNDSYYG